MNIFTYEMRDKKEIENTLCKWLQKFVSQLQLNWAHE